MSIDYLRVPKKVSISPRAKVSASHNELKALASGSDASDKEIAYLYTIRADISEKAT
jgi:hypothetical protein